MARSFWDEFLRLQRQMDALVSNMFGESFEALPYSNAPATFHSFDLRTPLVDVVDAGKNLVVSFEIPGVDKRDINLNVDKHFVEVKVERKSENKLNKNGIFRIERSYSGFYRRVPLPVEVVPERANASYKNGVLEVVLPKKDKSSIKGRKIKIN